MKTNYVWLNIQLELEVPANQTDESLFRADLMTVKTHDAYQLLYETDTMFIAASNLKSTKGTYAYVIEWLT